MRQRSRLTVVPAALAIVVGSAATAWAIRPSLPRLSQFAHEGTTVAFRQPDGTATTMAVRSGAVLERGGEVPRDWQQPRECDLASMPCRFAGGVVTLGQDQGRTVLEASGDGWAWRAGHVHYGSAVLRRMLEVEGTLLLDGAAFGFGTLEAVDLRSGRSLWIYAYPSPSFGLAMASAQVAGARERLIEFARHAAAGPVGTADVAAVDSGRPYQGTVVLDPDPLSERLVRRWVIAGWAALGVLLAAWALVYFRLPAGANRSLLIVLLTAGVGAAVVMAGVTDTALAVASWVALVAIFFAAYHQAAGEGSIFRSCLWAAVLAFGVGAVTWVALGLLGAPTSLLVAAAAFVALLGAIQTTRQQQDGPSRLVLWAIMIATGGLFVLPWLLSALIR